MPDDTERAPLIEALAVIAEEEGVDTLLDFLADVWAAYAPLSDHPGIKVCWDLALGSDISVVTEIDGEGRVSLHTVQ